MSSFPSSTGPRSLRLPMLAAMALNPICAALAQTSPPLPTEQVVITGNPLGSGELAQPTQVLTGERLMLRRAGTLGETLEGLPGVGATWFGPNSNRPTIRGLDGDRVRLLDNAGATVDASNLSFDHAVALDPLVIERVDVLRGPASLLFGGNATGGVVNTLDNRVPREALTGLNGRVALRGGGAASERSAAAVLEGGQAGLNWHADLFGRRTSDLSVPRFVPQEDGSPLAPSSRVRNSAADARGGALGGSWADRDGFFGASVDTYRNHYGVTVEPDVTIRMSRERLNLLGQRKLDGLFRQVDAQFSATRYQHEEVEGSGEVGTTFSSRGQSLRLEAQHAPWGSLRGVWGLQAESMRFSALGEEAFVPGTRTRSAALFALEEGQWGAATLSGGLRLERVSVASDGDAAGTTEPRFGPAGSRRFTPLSASLSARWPLGGGWSGSGVLGHTERAPAYYELYANGLHIATAAFEQGDRSLGLERSQHADLGLQWRGQDQGLKLNLFAMQFSRFIALEATGTDVEVDNEDGGTDSVPLYQFRGVPARLWGLEFEGRQGWQAAGWQWSAGATLDLTRATQRNTGEPLPRIAPMRLGLNLEAGQGGWKLGAGVQHAWAQRRVPATDVATSAYTLLNLWARHAWSWGPMAGTAFVKLDNLTDELAFSAGAIRTVRELSPRPGRAASVGMELQF